MTVPYNPDQNYTNGYSCPKCGAFVNYGQYHECDSGTGKNPNPPTYYPPFPQYVFQNLDNVNLGRIATALEKMLDIMEKSAKIKGLI